MLAAWFGNLLLYLFLLTSWAKLVSSINRVSPPVMQWTKTWAGGQSTRRSSSQRRWLLPASSKSTFCAGCLSASWGRLGFNPLAVAPPNRSQDRPNLNVIPNRVVARSTNITCCGLQLHVIFCGSIDDDNSENLNCQFSLHSASTFSPWFHRVPNDSQARGCLFVLLVPHA